MTGSDPFSWPALRRATPARIGLGRAGLSVATADHLAFQLAHAQARDAVYAALDGDRIIAELAATGLEVLPLRSAATDRLAYLRRPDLGRRLDTASRYLLTVRPAAAVQILFVIADGLSATAVNSHAAPLVKAALSLLDESAVVGPVVLVEGGRVAIGDEVGGLLGADLVAVLIGERPGLSAADSTGVYVTWQPAPGTPDSARNCLSNIRPQGMPVAEAADALVRLIVAAQTHRMTGVALSGRMADAAISAPDLKIKSS